MDDVQPVQNPDDQPEEVTLGNPKTASARLVARRQRQRRNRRIVIVAVAIIVVTFAAYQLLAPASQPGRPIAQSTPPAASEAPRVEPQTTPPPLEPVAQNVHAGPETSETTAPASGSAPPESPVVQPATEASPSPQTESAERADVATTPSTGHRASFDEAFRVLSGRKSRADFLRTATDYRSLNVVQFLKLSDADVPDAGSFCALFDEDRLTDIIQFDGSVYRGTLTQSTYHPDHLRNRARLWFRAAGH